MVTGEPDPLFTADLELEEMADVFSPEARQRLLTALAPGAAPVELVSLTPLGMHGVRKELLAKGRIAPLVGQLVDAEPGQLLGVVAEQYLPDTGRDEISGWLAARGEDGVEQLIDAVRDCPFRSRATVLLKVLADALPDGEALLRELRTDPVLGPIAAHELVFGDFIDEGDLSERERLLLGAENLVQALETAGPDDLRGMLEGLPRTERQEILSKLAQCGHPDEKAIAELHSLVIEPLERRVDVHPLSGLVRRSRPHKKRRKR